MRGKKTLAAGVTLAVAIAAAIVVHQQPASQAAAMDHSMMNHGQPPSAVEAAAMERLQAAPVPGSEFRAECRSSHRAGDDPIVFPGQAGASHIHEFYGNTTTNAGSTLQSLRLGGTNCDPVADKSAYWTPTLYQNGVPVAPERLTIYYQGITDHTHATAYPHGLRYVIGNAASTTASRPATSAARTATPSSSRARVVPRLPSPAPPSPARYYLATLSIAGAAMMTGSPNLLKTELTWSAPWS